MSTLHADRATLLNEWYGQISTARPFLRWVGGKQTFLVRFGNLLPHVLHGRYFEPFLGGGSSFFFLQRRTMHPVDAILSDVNVPLIRTYAAVQSDPESVYQRLAELQRGYLASPSQSSFYYDARSRYNESLPKPDPADFIFINRTCWNGLYRLNRRGHFNVPYGRPKTDVVIPPRDELISAAAALVRARLRATSWENSIAQARAGDFIFLDPPYFSDVVKEDVKYRSRRFGLSEHERLAARLPDLADRGVDFILTNSAEPEMVELYRSYGLTLHVVKNRRSISTKMDQRHPVDELIVTPRLPYESPMASARAAAFQALQPAG